MRTESLGRRGHHSQDAITVISMGGSGVLKNYQVQFESPQGILQTKREGRSFLEVLEIYTLVNHLFSYDSLRSSLVVSLILISLTPLVVGYTSNSLY